MLRPGALVHSYGEKSWPQRRRDAEEDKNRGFLPLRLCGPILSVVNGQIICTLRTSITKVW